ncbi:MAG: hypothetical protein AAB482_04680 [Patescibacteria group bacterium]
MFIFLQKLLYWASITIFVGAGLWLLSFSVRRSIERGAWDFYGTASTEIFFAIIAFICAYALYRKSGGFLIFAIIALASDIPVRGGNGGLFEQWTLPIVILLFLNLILNWNTLFSKTKAVQP